MKSNGAASVHPGLQFGDALLRLRTEEDDHEGRLAGMVSYQHADRPHQLYRSC